MGKISVKNLDLYYGDFKALKNINLEIEANKITAFIGPSGCGKSTLLKSINRMNDLVEGCRIDGEILLDGQNIFKGMDVNLLRKRVGMVFQKPNPFPMSIYDNIAYGPRTHGIRSKAKLDDIVEKSLRNAAIWDECKDRLKKSALGMSGGQQQRLCIARALAVEPEVLLMDEPTSALDPISTSKIEDLAMELKKDYTIVMVTHNMQQAVRVSDNTAFFQRMLNIQFIDRTNQPFCLPAPENPCKYHHHNCQYPDHRKCISCHSSQIVHRLCHAKYRAILQKDRIIIHLFSNGSGYADILTGSTCKRLFYLRTFAVIFQCFCVIA